MAIVIKCFIYASHVRNFIVTPLNTFDFNACYTMQIAARLRSGIQVSHDAAFAFVPTHWNALRRGACREHEEFVSHTMALFQSDKQLQYSLNQLL